MNIQRAVAISLFVLLCLGLVGQTIAQNRVPGVKGGDYFTYTLASYWSSDDPNATVPTTLLDINNTLWYKFAVSGVSGPNVTATDIWHFVNGTEQNFLVSQNVDTGDSYYMNAFQTVVGANLGVGDLLHPLGGDLITINQTITRSYASGARDTNLVILSFSNSTIGTENVTYSFDKATGMMVELQDNSEYISPRENSSVTWTLKETNLWTVSGFSSSLPLPILVAVIVIVIVVIVALLLVLRNRGRRKPKKGLIR